MSIAETDNAAIAASVAGWNVADNYHDADDLLRLLHEPPYDSNSGPSLAESLRSHLWIVLTFLAAFIAISGYLFSVVRMKKRTKDSCAFLQSVID